MTSWIIIIALYLLGMSLLAWAGGIAAASDAISRWGGSRVEGLSGSTCR
ncbi:MAG TPA: hypothetical protein VLW49_07690 [Gaiellaceae bacterium]|nr:hypothetical protein [Gaiellaceae bacterium]